MRITAATIWGLIIILCGFFVVVVLPNTTSDKTVDYLANSAFGILRLGFIFYGQTVVKKLNRNYTLWSALLFFFPGISLLILGQLNVIVRPLTIIELKANWNNNEEVQLRDLTIGADSIMLLESIENDSLTLKHMIKNYPDYVKEYTMMFPVLAIYQLITRGEKITPEVIGALEKYAQQSGNSSFSELLNHLGAMSPEEINLWSSSTNN